MPQSGLRRLQFPIHSIIIIKINLLLTIKRFFLQLHQLIKNMYEIKLD